MTIGLAALVVCALAAPAQDAGRARATYDRAVALEAEGRDAEALSLLWAAAAEAPGDADIQQRLGEALERLGALDAAVEAYERALASRPASARFMNALVVALAKAGRGVDALDRATRWAGAAPGDADQLFTLGLAQSEQDVDAALATMRAVIARRPDHALAHHNLALLLKRSDRIDDAIAAAERAIAIQPRPESSLVLGTLLFQRGQLDRALAALDAAVAADARSVEAWVQLATVHRARGDLRRAADALRRAIAVRPDAWNPHAALAAVLAQAGDAAGARVASAEAERLRAVDRRRREATTLTAVGVARLDAGEAAVAAERFATAVAVDDQHAPAYFHLGRALERLGRSEDARRAFARAQQLNPALVPPATAR